MVINDPNVYIELFRDKGYKGVYVVSTRAKFFLHIFWKVGKAGCSVVLEHSQSCLFQDRLSFSQEPFPLYRKKCPASLHLYHSESRVSRGTLLVRYSCTPASPYLCSQRHTSNTRYCNLNLRLKEKLKLERILNIFSRFSRYSI